MKKKLQHFTCLFSAAFICISGIFAQDTTTQTTVQANAPLFKGTSGFRTWSFGVSAGAMAPFSAFGGRNDFSNWQPDLGYGIYLKKQISHTFGIQLDAQRGTLKANNDRLWAGAPPPGPYASYKTDLHYALSLSGVATLGNINWSQLRTSIQPYVSIGAGVVNYNTTLITKTGTSVNFKPAESVSTFYVPVGLGIKANLSSRVNLDLGYTMGFVDGDELDGYFKEPIMNDRFSFAHIGLEFSLGNSKKPQLARHNAPAQLSSNMTNANNALKSELAASEARNNEKIAELNRLKMDSDGDGVSDYFDKCPNTLAGIKVDGGGCPLPVAPKVIKDTVVKIENNTTYIITPEDQMIVTDTFRNLEFEFAKSTIRKRSLPYLDKLSNLLVKKGISLKLAGHTDYVGSDAANMILSKERAESVKTYLISQGSNPSRIEAVGYGETQPIANNKTDAGRQKNRRVEMTIY